MRAHESQSPQIDVNGNELLGLTCPRRTTHLDRYFQSVTAAGLGQQIAAVTFEAGVKSRSLEVEVMDSQIEPKVKLLELKVIKMEGDSSHYRLGY